MYTCGPTVYDFAHIGNFRTFLFQDVLRRYLKYAGYELRHVVNLTDVDDNTIRNSQAAGMPLRAYTDKYIEAFLDRSPTPEPGGAGVPGSRHGLHPGNGEAHPGARG